MLTQGKGAIRLFKVFGIQVFLHWSWFLVAFYQISQRKEEYGAIVWMVWEYLTLFLIVLLHEFGHSLACRSVGGRAEEIILWPFGGIAYVQAPPRPGANLWAIAAGPLVNVALVPVIFVLQLLAHRTGFLADSADAEKYLENVGYINLGLLIFNVIPVYPLDGGQILRSLLWFFVGPIKSLLIASGLGLLGGVGLAIYALSLGSTWMVMISIFLLMQAWRGFQAAREWDKQQKAIGETEPPPI